MGLQGREASGNRQRKPDNKKRKASWFLFTKCNQSLYASCPVTITCQLKLEWLPSNVTPTYLLEGRERLSPQKALYGNVHIKFIHHSPQMELAKCPPAGQMVVCPCNGNTQWQQRRDSWYIQHKYISKWSCWIKEARPDTKEYTLDDFIHINF